MAVLSACAITRCGLGSRESFDACAWTCRSAASVPRVIPSTQSLSSDVLLNLDETITRE